MVDIGLNIETEPSPVPGSSRFIRQSLTQDSFFPPSRATSARSILRVTPHYAPRPMIEPSPALRSLLVGAQLSHYNYLVGSARTPTKKDYFHEKTLIYNFTPSFRSTHFAHSKFELPRTIEKPPIAGSPEPVLPRKTSIVTPQHRRASSRKQILKPKPSPEQPIRPLIRTYTTHTLRFSQYQTTTTKLRPRPILCVEDGQNLSKPNLRTHSIDFLEYIHKYIGFVQNPESEPENRDAVSLKNQALLDLLETVNHSLRPAKPFTCIFTLEGSPLTDLSLLPPSCRVLLFSSLNLFQGLHDS